MNVDGVITYLDFVAERHRVFEHRQAGDPQPWTTDPVLRGHKFTNTFRILDYGSQFLLSMLTEDLDPRETLARCFLYRHTGRVEPWEFYEVKHGRYPLIEDFPLALETWKEYRGGVHESVRADTGRVMMINERPVFTGAYLVFPQSQIKGTDKLDAIVDLAARLFTPGGPQDVVPAFLHAETQLARFQALRRNPGVGDFMAMQILTDMSYSRWSADRENEFVVAGPGAVKGARTLFPNRKALEVIRWAQREIHDYPGEPTLTLPNGHTRTPSLMDVQNTLCEWSKYVRYEEKPTSGAFRPAHPGPQPQPIYPSHW